MNFGPIIAALLSVAIDGHADGVGAEPDYARGCLTIAAYSEAHSEGDLGMALVMQTVLNRLRDPKGRWPNTICGVVMQRGQYLGVQNWHPPRLIREPEKTHIMDLAGDVLEGAVVLPAACKGVTSFSQFKSSRATCHVGAHYFTKD